MNAPEPPTNAATVTDSERRQIVVGVLICMLLAALDQTIVAPVIPVLGATLGGSDYISWIVSIYFLTATATTPLYGKLADIHGRRPVLLAAVAIFVTGSIVCALSTNMPILIVGRAIQGLGGGGLMALAQTVTADLFPPRERGKIAGSIAIMWGVASIGGPVLGGVIAEHYHWSLIFWLNLPLAAFAVWMSNSGLRRLPWHRREHRLDLTGAGLIVAATVSLLLALALAPQQRFGWTAPTVLALFLATGVLWPLAAQHMRTVSEPLIPVGVLGNPIVLRATSSLFFAMMANIGLSLFVPLFLELAHGRTAQQAGFALVGLMMGTVVGANVAGRMTMRVEDYKSLPLIGLVVASATLAWVAIRAHTIGLIEFEVALIVTGLASGLQFPVTTVAVQNAVDVRDIGIATGLIAFMRALGSSIGVATLGAVGAISGIAITAAEHDRGTTLMTHIDPGAFAPVFFTASLAMALSCALFWAMPMKPLRGRA